MLRTPDKRRLENELASTMDLEGKDIGHDTKSLGLDRRHMSIKSTNQKLCRDELSHFLS